MKGQIKFLAICFLSAAVLLTAVSGVLAAETVSASTYAVDTGFSDLSTAAWAQKSIIKMKLRGIVQGYGNGTFQPNAEVRQVEALVMAVNDLGLGQRAAELGNQTYPALPKQVGKDVPKWAKGFIGAALEQGLIKTSENNFTWNAPATRAWVAQLMIRATGFEQETVAITGSASGFTDDATLPVWARKYIIVAQQKGLMKGYADGSFQGAKTVTRAEMATILAKGEQYVAVQNQIKAAVEAVRNDNIIVTVAGSLQRIYFNPALWVFRGETVSTAAALQEGDTVTMLTNGPASVMFIDVTASSAVQPITPPSPSAAVISGQVLGVESAANQIRVKVDDGNTNTYDLATDVTIVIPGVSAPHIADIKVTDRVDLTMAATKVARVKVYRNAVITGKVISVATDKREITVEDDASVRSTYALTPDADIIIAGQIHPYLSNIKPADKVELRLVEGKADRVTLVSVNQSFVVGELVQVFTDSKYLRLKDRLNNKTAYSLMQDPTIEIPGNGNAKAGDLEAGKPVLLLTEDNKVTGVIQGRIKEGTIESWNGDNYTLVLKYADNRTETFDVFRTADGEYAGRKMYINGLMHGDKVQAYIFGNKVYLVAVTQLASQS